MQTIMVAGHLCLDIYPTFSAGRGDFLQSFSPGKLFDVGPVTFSTGGTVSNTGLACVRFGAPTLLTALLGDDLFGQQALDLLKSKGGRTDKICVRKDLSTSYTIVLAPPGMDRVFFHHPGSNDRFNASYIDFDILKETGLFHFGYPPLMRSMFESEGAELASIYKRVHRSGAVTSMDMALPDPVSPAGKAPWETILRETLPDVDLFLPSIEELLYMLDRSRLMARKSGAGSRNIVDAITAEDVSVAAGEALKLGAGAVLVKCGHRGLYLRTAAGDRLRPACERLGMPWKEWAGRELWQPCFHVAEIAGATGAGDSAIAGFLCACLRGERPESALQYAAAAGSFNVTKPDSLSGLVSWEEMTRAINNVWQLDPLDIRTPGWERDPELGQWLGPCDRA